MNIWKVTTVLTSLLFINPKVSACSCAIRSIEQEYQESDLIFEGKISAKNLGSKPLDEIVVSVDVSRVFKGAADETLTFVTPPDSAMCGYDFIEGQSYLIWLYRSENGTMNTNLCFRNTPLSQSGELIDWLEAHSGSK
jgi:hypothetical protein